MRDKSRDSRQVASVRERDFRRQNSLVRHRKKYSTPKKTGVQKSRATQKRHEATTNVCKSHRAFIVSITGGCVVLHGGRDGLHGATGYTEDVTGYRESVISYRESVASDTTSVTKHRLGVTNDRLSVTNDT